MSNKLYLSSIWNEKLALELETSDSNNEWRCVQNILYFEMSDVEDLMAISEKDLWI
jgi:hypothetical protein